jgi:hypothetical protein
MRCAEVLKFEDHPDLEFGRFAPTDRRALATGVSQRRFGRPKPAA